VVEYGIYGAPGELPTLPDLEAAAAGALVRITTEEIPDDWSERWRQFHRPLTLGDRLTVRPPWEPRGATSLDVVIDPGRAFGTGAHATTRLCLELMLDEPHPRGAFVDLGCGSGVLGIVAAELGFSPVIGLDNDPAAVTATRENARANGVRLQARNFDLMREQVPDCDFVAANVLALPLGAWAASQRRLPLDLILSGLLEREADLLVNVYAARGLREQRRLVRGEWAALKMTASG
jgi:ribosomal protein L11 methyltransferase